MKFLRAHFTELRLALIVAAALVGSGTIVAWQAELHFKNSEAQHEDAIRLRNEAAQRLHDLEHGGMRARERAAMVAAIRNRGLIGDERRVDWIRLLDEIRHSGRVAALDYRFSAPQAIDTETTPDPRFRRSEMQLHLRLLHEGDFLFALAQLRERASALIRIRHCRLTRLADEAGGDGQSPRIDAHCRLDWITVNLPEAGA